MTYAYGSRTMIADVVGFIGFVSSPIEAPSASWAALYHSPMSISQPLTSYKLICASSDSDLTIARPIAYIPRMRAPSKAKCCSPLSRRGLLSGVNCWVSGS